MTVGSVRLQMAEDGILALCNQDSYVSAFLSPAESRKAEAGFSIFYNQVLFFSALPLPVFLGRK